MRRTDDRVPLLSLRLPQLVALVDGLRPAFVVHTVEELRLRFPHGLHGVCVDEYEPTLRGLVARIGERYGIIAPRDVLGVVGLATRRGWHLDEGDAGAWVRAILADARVSSPTRRVSRLLAESQRRAQIEARNHAIDAALQAGRRPR